MLILVSIILYLVPDKMIITYLGNKNKYLGIILASIFGSITLIPGFIAYPLCGILLKKRCRLYGISGLYYHPNDGRCNDLSC